MKLRWKFSANFSIYLTEERHFCWVLWGFFSSAVLCFFCGKNRAKVNCSVASVECSGDQCSRSKEYSGGDNCPEKCASLMNRKQTFNGDFIGCLLLSVSFVNIEWRFAGLLLRQIEKYWAYFFLNFADLLGNYTPILFFLPGDLIDFPCCCGLLFSSPLSPCFVWSGKWGVVGWKKGGDRKLAIQQTWATVERKSFNQANKSMHLLSKSLFFPFFRSMSCPYQKSIILPNSL